jgi:hypothetical protein
VSIRSKYIKGRQTSVVAPSGSVESALPAAGPDGRGGAGAGFVAGEQRAGGADPGTGSGLGSLHGGASGDDDLGELDGGRGALGGDDVAGRVPLGLERDHRGAGLAGESGHGGDGDESGEEGDNGDEGLVHVDNYFRLRSICVCRGGDFSFLRLP